MKAMHIVIYSSLLVWSDILFIQKTIIIRQPQPTVFTENIPKSDLVVIKKISSQLDRNHLLLRPTSIAVDGRNNIYIFDSLQSCIFKIEGNNNKVLRVGQRGNRMGEWGGKEGLNNVMLKASSDKLVAYDAVKKEFQVFSDKLSLIRVIKLKNTRPRMIWLLRKNGELNYAVIENEKILIRNDNEKIIKSIQLKGENTTFIYKEPSFIIKEFIINDFNLNVIDENYLCFFPYSSKIVISSNINEMVRNTIIPKDKLEKYHYNIEKIENQSDYSRLSDSFFVDEDEEHSFYIFYNNLRNSNNRDSELFEFDISCSLKCIYCVKSIGKTQIKRILMKKNKRFYAIANDEILVLGEKKRL